MAIELDKSSVMKLLHASYQKCMDKPVETCSIKDTIDFVMHGKNCLTYRYIMFTALVAKASNHSIDILSLQAGDNSDGAYDARSIAKDVIYVFQKSMLGDILDGKNNDPLVNKPGRFERLSKDNSVAGGDPAKALEKLCADFPSIQTSTEARECVDYIVSMLLAEKKEREKQKELFGKKSTGINLFKTQKFINDLLDQGFGGASLVIVTTALYHFLFNGNDFSIVPHPVNQPGSSPRQFSDVDVFQNDKPFMGTELKDKPFTINDVERAAQSSSKVGASSLLFVAGRQSSFASQPPTYFADIRNNYSKLGLYIGLASIDSLLNIVFARFINENVSHLLEQLRETAENIGAIEAQLWIYSHINDI